MVVLDGEKGVSLESETTHFYKRFYSVGVAREIEVYERRLAQQ